MVTTRQLAEKIVEIYWPHTVPFAGRLSTKVLKQNTVGQAEIVSAIMRFRARYATDPSVPRWQSRLAARQQYDRLVNLVEWKLIEMPIAKLQRIGGEDVRWLYEIRWLDKDGAARRGLPMVREGDVRRYQQGKPNSFDNLIRLLPEIGRAHV